MDDNLNPVSSIAKILKTKESKIILIFILFLVLILEPLSIGLTVAVNAAWLNHTKKSTCRETPQNGKDLTKELRNLQEKNQLSVSQIAKITGRKRLKTCEGWLKGTIPTPPRVLIEIQTWLEKHGRSQKPICLLKQGSENDK